MIGPLVRRLVMFPIPPRYSAPAVATAALTAAMVALVQAHSFPGVLAAATGAAVLVFGVRALCLAGRRAD
jgi:hypothetical protein